MRKNIISSFCLLAFLIQGLNVSAQDSRTKVNSQVAVAVTSDVRMSRPNETVSLDWKTLLKHVPFLKPDYVIVRDTQTGKTVPSQTIDYDFDGKPDELIFQTDFAAREASRIFIVEDSKDRIFAPASKTYGRYVPERDDDFAWENDRIAFRMYGEDLEPRLVSSGIDLWLKRTRESIIDLWFKGGDAYYHKDNGTGIDLYSVKNSRGCGGSGIWENEKLHVSRNYRDFRIIANGPVCTVFELFYQPWDVNGAKISETKRITLDAGQNLNKIESFYKVEGNLPTLNIGVGIARHESEFSGTFDANKENGWMSRWETTKTDGSFGCAVVAAPTQITKMFDEQGVTDTANEHPHHFMILSSDANKTVRYYAGGGWDKSGDFKDRKAWNAYLENFAARVNSPLKISFLTKTSADNMAVKIADSWLAAYPDPKRFGTNPRWHYDNAYLLLAVLELGKRTNNQKYINYVKGWADAYVSADGAIDNRQIREKEYELDSILPGRILLELYARTKDEKYRKAIFNLVEELKNHPRTKDGGYWHKKVYAGQMWLDGIYMAGPFSVEFARAFNQPEWYQEAAEQIEMIYAKTIDAETGLLYHGWDESKSLIWANRETGVSPEFWGRAIGWYVVALVDELEVLPADHPTREARIKILQDVSAALLNYQDKQTGLWYQIIDKPERPDNWHETSASAMFAYAFAKGAKNGWLDGKYTQAARKAYDGLITNHVYTDRNGRVYFTGTVFIGTLNPKTTTGDYASYINTERQTDDVKGVGSLLFAALELER